MNDPPDLVPVSTLLADFDRLRLQEAQKQAEIKAQIDDDELQNFSYKIVKKDQNTSRSSKDSGFTDDSEEEKREEYTKELSESGIESELNEVDDELVENLKGLELSTGDEKNSKKLQQVFIARGKDAQKGFKPLPFTPYQTVSVCICM